jgi:para-nitrobenzyl esterase
MTEAKLNLDVNIDGYSVPEWSPRVYAEGRQAHVPMVIGNNGKDSPSFRPSPTPEAAQEAIANRVNAIYGAYPDLLQKAKAAYAEGSEDASHGSVEYQATVDYSFRCTDAVVARWQSTVAPTYHYEFTAGNANHPPVHSAELDFVFGYMRDQAQDPTLAKLSEQMQSYWTNFAKTGDPNGAGMPEWPRFDSTTRKYLDLTSAGPQQKADLRSAVCPLYYEKLTRDLAVR